MTTSWALLASGTGSETAQELKDKVTPGLGGFLVVFVLALVTVLLVRSMTSHLRKVRYSPDPAAEHPEPRGGESLDTAETAEAAEPDDPTTPR
jgi:hypothetical protein